MFQKDLGSLDLSYRKKHDGTDLWMFPTFTAVRGLATEKLTFKQYVILSMQDPGKAFFFQGRKGIHRVCVSRPLSCMNHFAESSVAALSA